ncbi:MAG: LEPR-XLL domain-containing protein, partial [Planctomycetes bacterium]|nr:LEPR-XLL domain-containing protein [Planctomycetota bacterium]
MSLLRKLRRKIQTSAKRTIFLEQLEPRLLLSADLGVDDFGIEDSITPPPFMWGDDVSIFTDLSNYGEIDTGSFSVKIMLSPDENPDVSDYELHANASMDSIASGATGIVYDTSVNLTNNDSWPDGDYYLIFTSEVTGDSNMSNNGMGVPVHIGQNDPPPGGGIDLVVDDFSIDGTGPFSWGDSVTLAADVRNTGDTDSGAFSFDVVLSEDNVLDGSDTILDSVAISAVAPGGTSINDVTVTLPGTGTDGQKYLFMSIDPSNAVTEVDENNNLWNTPIEIGSGDPPPVGGIDMTVEEF